MYEQADFILVESNKKFNYHFKLYLSTKLSLLLILFNLGLSTFLDAQPIITSDLLPDFEIEGRARNSSTGFEGALFTPDTPAPGQPSGVKWQMNPVSIPAWNNNVNHYDDIHSFDFSFYMATGMSVWMNNFNRDGDHKDKWDLVTNISPSLTGKSFKYINLDIHANALDIFCNKPPVCSVTSPSGSSQFYVNETIHIVADARDSDGTITKVQFFSGSVKIGEDLNNPYTFDLTVDSPGPVLITAKAYDNKTAYALSSPVTVFVEAPVTCTITEPLNNSEFRNPDIITVNADVSGQNIQVVDFYVDGNWLAADSIQPFSAGLLNPSPGNHIITAIAKNNYGNVASSTSVNITIKCIPEDFDNNNLVDVNDFSVFINKYGQYCTCDEDLDGNGYVNIADFSIFVNKIGHSCN